MYFQVTAADVVVADLVPVLDEPFIEPTPSTSQPSRRFRSRSPVKKNRKFSNSESHSEKEGIKLDILKIRREKERSEAELVKLAVRDKQLDICRKELELLKLEREMQQ